MFNFNTLSKDLQNLDWTRIGWHCLGIVGILIYLFKFLKLGFNFYKLYADENTETNENTGKITEKEKDVKSDNEKKED